MARDSLSSDSTRDRYTDSALSLHGLPGDLALLLTYMLLASGMITQLNIQPPLQFVIGIPLALFVPGYSLLAALFPGRPSRNADQVSPLTGVSEKFNSLHSIQQRGVRWGERVILSFGLSLFLIPLLALPLDLTATLLENGSLYRTGPIIGILMLSSFSFVVVGTIRRLRLPRTQRFAVPVGGWIDDFIESLSNSPVDALLNLVLILSITAALASMGYAFAAPQDGTTTTGFRVGSLDESGQFTIDPPTNLTEGEQQQFAISVKNDEQQMMNYTIVTQLERRNGSAVEINRFSTTIPSNRTWQTQRTIIPTTTGDNLRLKFLLYRGDAPQNATEATAYQPIDLSVSISSNNSGR